MGSKEVRNFEGTTMQAATKTIVGRDIPWKNRLATKTHSQNYRYHVITRGLPSFRSFVRRTHTETVIIISEQKKTTTFGYRITTT